MLAEFLISSTVLGGISGYLTTSMILKKNKKNNEWNRLYKCDDCNIDFSQAFKAKLLIDGAIENVNSVYDDKCPKCGKPGIADYNLQGINIVPFKEIKYLEKQMKIREESHYSIMYDTILTQILTGKVEEEKAQLQIIQEKSLTEEKIAIEQKKESYEQLNSLLVQIVRDKKEHEKKIKDLKDKISKEEITKKNTNKYSNKRTSIISTRANFQIEMFLSPVTMKEVPYFSYFGSNKVYPLSSLYYRLSSNNHRKEIIDTCRQQQSKTIKDTLMFSIAEGLKEIYNLKLIFGFTANEQYLVAVDINHKVVFIDIFSTYISDLLISSTDLIRKVHISSSIESNVNKLKTFSTSLSRELENYIPLYNPNYDSDHYLKKFAD